MKKLCIISVLLLTPLLWRGAGGEAFCQSHTIDSLLTLIKTDEPDTNKVNHLNKLSREYIVIGEYNNGLKYGNKALALASSILDGNKRGWDYGVAYANNNIGNIYSRQGNLGEALKRYSIALKIREESGDKKGIASTLGNIGIIFNSQGNYPEALKNYFKSLKINEEIGDKLGIANIYNNIGNIYSKQLNYPEALKNYLSSLKIREEINDKQGMATSYNNLGIIYFIQGDYSQALKNYLASIKIGDDIKDKRGISMSYSNIGLIYKEQKNYPEALKNYFAALKINKEIGDKHGIAISLINISMVNTQLNKLIDARKYLNKALQVSILVGSTDDIKNCYGGLAGIDSMQHNWKAAYQHHKLFIVYRDSIDNEETKKKTIESSMNYEFEKKKATTKAEQERKDAITEANKKRQQVVLLLVSCVLLLVFVFAIFVVRSLRNTKKQKNIIELQKNEVSRQKEIVSGKNKEITDSINYAQRIQRALLASNKMLNENLNSPLLWRGAGGEASFFIFFQPKDIVSGDFYWASPLANGNFALVIADSTGHGVPGAIMSMLNISCLNEAVKGQQLTAPNEILNYTRSKIIEHLTNDGSAEGGKDGMDCSLMSFEFNPRLMLPSTIDEGPGGSLTYSAANNPVWIVRSKQIIELEPDKMPVGKHERDKISFAQYAIELQKDDIVYAFTDGFADQFGGPKGKKFMAKQLKELLISICHLPMNGQKERLSAEFNNWKGDLEQVDDITIIGIRV